MVQASYCGASPAAEHRLRGTWASAVHASHWDEQPKVTKWTFTQSGVALHGRKGAGSRAKALSPGIRCPDCAESQFAHYQMGIMILA